MSKLDSRLKTIQQSENTNDNGSSSNTAVNDDEEKPIKRASHSRHVHFPDDDSELRTFSTATDPFAGKPLATLGLILQHYRTTCERLQIRPIAALVDQLNLMDDGRKSFDDRLDCLRIVNEKLDGKSIEAIEEIFSRCRFHTIDLQGTVFENDALADFFDIFTYYESCTHLNMSNNRPLSGTSLQQFMNYLRRTCALERLDMNSSRFDDLSINKFNRFIRLSSSLYELHVESCQINGTVLQKFIDGLRFCTNLRELYLCDNRIQAQDSPMLTDLIRTCGRFLHVLDLRSNALQDKGLSHVASQLSQYDRFHTNENQLVRLSIEANQLTTQGIRFLAKCLLHNRTLRSINLSNNDVGNEGLFLLRDALLVNRMINELILRNCRLTDQAAIALAEFIAESTTIHYIDLRENCFQASGICGIANAIKNNHSLLRLDFDPIPVTPAYLNPLLPRSLVDRTTSYGLLSLWNIRRMTSNFTGSMMNSSAPLGGGGTRELLEQKARWMDDIAAVCQRNVLIYEENRLSQVEAQENIAENQDSTVPEIQNIEWQLSDPQELFQIEPFEIADGPNEIQSNSSHTVPNESNDNDSTTLSQLTVEWIEEQPTEVVDVEIPVLFDSNSDDLSEENVQNDENHSSTEVINFEF